MCGKTTGKYIFHEVNLLRLLQELNFRRSCKMQQIVKKTLRYLHHDSSDYFISVWRDNFLSL